MRGPKTIAEACAATEISDFEVYQLLWAFCALGWVGPVPEIAAKATSGPEIVAEEAPASEPMPIIEAAAEIDRQHEKAPVKPVEENDLEGLGMLLKDDPLA